MIFNHDLSRYRYQLAQQFNPPEGDRYYTPLDKPEPQFPSITGVLGADPDHGQTPGMEDEDWRTRG